MPSVQRGDRAPDFTAPTASGEPLRLSDFLGKHVIVLFFYPKDHTSVCTREACAFRDAYEQFVDAGAIVIGISSDSADSHRTFADRHNLPYYLASDTGGELRKLYGVPKTLGIFPGRVTYVIDKQGIVRTIFNAQLAANAHVEAALKTVRELTAAT